MGMFCTASEQILNQSELEFEQDKHILGFFSTLYAFKIYHFLYSIYSENVHENKVKMNSCTVIANSIQLAI